MLSALKSAKPHNSFPFSYSLPNHITRKSPSAIRFVQVASDPNQPHQMDSQKKSDSESKTTVDSMSSLGEGYATRCDEEGFGGIYGGNQYVSKDDGGETKVHGDDAEFDHDQGSEVKEKEKARHQNKAAS